MFEHLKSEAHVWSYFHRIYGKDFIEEDYHYDGKPELAKYEFQLALNDVIMIVPFGLFIMKLKILHLFRVMYLDGSK